ncbi:MarR family winged helix-turn-helix transcriptional regulator [uncultured Enterovirga sp.]|uniref:MarR family winged helix-turn-helix transcriptional regulator n=1 Tax=uncultured Enterovirga sp. TaxID=2026352 RepID=UPI0035CA2621
MVNEQVGYLLRVAVQRHTSIFTSMMIEGITQTQFATLAKLLEIGPCSHNKLGRLIALDAPTIKGVIDRLQVRGFVVSTADETHRSRRMVQLTERGSEVTAEAVRIGASITEATLKPLQREQRDNLMELLRLLTSDA